VDHSSFRDQLAFSIGFAVTRSRALLCRLLTEHGSDDASRMLAQGGSWSTRAVVFRDRQSRGGYEEAPSDAPLRLTSPLRLLGFLSLESLQRRPGTLQPFRRSVQRSACFRGIELGLRVVELPRPELNIIHARDCTCAGTRTEDGSGSTERVGFRKSKGSTFRFSVGRAPATI
jgi:hypothetical protein